MLIIKHGTYIGITYRFTCPKCGCIYDLDAVDLNEKIVRIYTTEEFDHGTLNMIAKNRYDLKLVCPDCEFITHLHEIDLQDYEHKEKFFYE